MPAAELSPTVNYKKRLAAKPVYAPVSSVLVCPIVVFRSAKESPFAERKATD
jgi:hypothetical protein